jgi:hypothetical protein
MLPNEDAYKPQYVSDRLWYGLVVLDLALVPWEVGMVLLQDCRLIVESVFGNPPDAAPSVKKGEVHTAGVLDFAMLRSLNRRAFRVLLSALPTVIGEVISIHISYQYRAH